MDHVEGYTQAPHPARSASSNKERVVLPLHGRFLSCLKLRSMAENRVAPNATGQSRLQSEPRALVRNRGHCSYPHLSRQPHSSVSHKRPSPSAWCRIGALVCLLENSSLQKPSETTVLTYRRDGCGTLASSREAIYNSQSPFRFPLVTGVLATTL